MKYYNKNRLGKNSTYFMCLIVVFFYVCFFLTGCLGFGDVNVMDIFNPRVFQPSGLPPREDIDPNLPNEIKAEIERLYSLDPIERAYGAMNLRLKGLKASPAIPYLIGILDDETDLEWVAGKLQMAVSSLSNVYPSHTSPAKQAMAALKAIGEPAVMPLIIKLREKGSYGRPNAARTLRLIGDKRAVEPLIQTLKEKPSGNKWECQLLKMQAAEALGDLGDYRAVKPLINSLKSEEGWIKEHVANALVKLGDKRAFEPLMNSLTTEEGETKAHMAKALGKLGDKRAIESLQRALRDKNAFVRAEACIALGNFNEESSIGPLLEATKDSNSKVRINSIVALSKYRDPRVADAIFRATKDKDYFVTHKAVTALGSLEDKRAIAVAIEALKEEEYSINIRISAARIGAIRISAESALQAQLERRGLYVRPKGPIDAELAEMFLKGMKGQSKRGKLTLIRWMGHLGDKCFVKALISALDDEDSDVRKAAARALRRIPDSQSFQIRK